MKNTLKSFRFLLTALVIAGLALTLSFTTKAEDQPLDKMAQLESQVQSLLQFKQQVENYNPNIVPTIDDFKNVDQAPQQLGGEGTNLPPSGSCTTGYKDFPTSQIYHEADWDMARLTFSQVSTGGQFQDLNGDGLVDNFYRMQDSNYLLECVNFNNGRGWENVFKCYGKRDQNLNTWTFYGDCALTE